MTKTMKRPAPPKRLRLRAATAAELMVENPISLRCDATVREAVALMINRGFSVAPVVDDGGRAVGVVSVSDILIHNRAIRPGPAPDDDGLFTELRRYSGLMRGGEGTEFNDPTKVEAIMTPVVLAVRRDTPAAEVVRKLVAHRVHHLFVAEDDGTVIGVIGMSDVVRNLGWSAGPRPEAAMNTISKPMAKLTADDLMTRDLLVLSDDTPLREAAHMLIRHQVSGAPVIDRHGKFAGILSALDFVRAVNNGGNSPGESTANPLACRFQACRPNFAGTLCTLPMGACAVQHGHTDEGGRRWVVCSQPHEMFVDWQVTEVAALPAGTVGQFMTRDVVTVRRSTPVREIARKMIDAHIHRVVVMENDEYPVGIVTSTDILGAVAALAEPAAC